MYRQNARLLLTGTTLGLSLILIFGAAVVLVGRADITRDQAETSSQPGLSRTLPPPQRWFNFHQETFLDQEGRLVSAGLIYFAYTPRPAVRQPIVNTTCTGFFYEVTAPGWHWPMRGEGSVSPTADAGLVRWSGVWQAGVDR
jgi:hypothetical protein